MAKKQSGGDKVGRNVRTAVEGKELVIRIKLDAAGQPSKSGKNNVIASTGGNQSVPGLSGKLGLNYYEPIDD